MYMHVTFTSIPVWIEAVGILPCLWVVVQHQCRNDHPGALRDGPPADLCSLATHSGNPYVRERERDDLCPMADLLIDRMLKNVISNLICFCCCIPISWWVTPQRLTDNHLQVLHILRGAEQ